MDRRPFLFDCGGSLALPCRGLAQTSLGTLVLVEAGAIWVRELPHGPSTIVAPCERLAPSGAWIAYRKR